MKLFRKKKKKVGLVMGGGGVRGLAHIHVLEMLDELGIQPHIIAGTSIGAVMGALYASGLSGAEIRELAHRVLLRKAEKFSDVFTRKDLLKWVGLIDPAFHKGALLKGERFMRFLSESMKCDSFEELKIPLHISATDFQSGKEVVFSSGDLLSAVRASMAVPGIFSSVERDGKRLVDGGLVNPLPCSLIREDCDVMIAVDVSGSFTRKQKKADFFDATLSGFDIVQSALISEHLKKYNPEIYLKPDLKDIRIFDFNRAENVLEQSEPIRSELSKHWKKRSR